MDITNVNYIQNNLFEITIHVVGAETIPLKYLYSLKIIGVDGPKGTVQLYGKNENTYLIDNPTDFTATFQVYGNLKDCEWWLPNFQIQFEYLQGAAAQYWETWVWGTTSFDLTTGCNNYDNNGRSQTDFPGFYWTINLPQQCDPKPPTSKSSSSSSLIIPSSSVSSSIESSSQVVSSTNLSSSMFSSSIASSSSVESSITLYSSLESSTVTSSSIESSKIIFSSVAGSSEVTKSSMTTYSLNSSIPETTKSSKTILSSNGNSETHFSTTGSVPQPASSIKTLSSSRVTESASQTLGTKTITNSEKSLHSTKTSVTDVKSLTVVSIISSSSTKVPSSKDTYSVTTPTIPGGSTTHSTGPAVHVTIPDSTLSSISKTVTHTAPTVSTTSSYPAINQNNSGIKPLFSLIKVCLIVVVSQLL